MESLAELAARVKSLLETKFSPAEIRLSGVDGIVVILVSTHFEEMDDMDRQERVWKFLAKHLDRDERRAISIVVAVTPDENTFHLAGALAKPTANPVEP